MERQEQSERDQEDGPWDKEEERARPPGGTSLRVLPRLLTCIASFNLPSPGDLGTLSTLCSEGTGPRAGKEQVRKSPGLHSRKRRVGKARPSHLDPTFHHPRRGSRGLSVLQAHWTADRVRVFGEQGRES